jgi:DNA-binding FrmR family transcriptional regulator
MNSLLFAPRLAMRALDDLSAIANAARQLESLQAMLVGRLDGLRGQLAGIGRQVEPLSDLAEVRAQLAAVHDAVEPLSAKLDVLRAEMRPIGQLTAVREQLEAVRAAVEPLDGKLDGLRREVEPIQELRPVRAGIEPLDDDLRQVRESIDHIEPIVNALAERIGGIDEKLADMSGDLAPVSDLAEKVPGISRG